MPLIACNTAHTCRSKLWQGLGCEGEFRAQWPECYAERTPADIAQDFCSEANRDGLPVRLVVFADGELAGTITLRDRATRISPEYHLGLGGLFVVERHRGRGIAFEPSIKEHQFANELFGSVDGVIFGRKTYKGFTSFWDTLDVTASSESSAVEIQFAQIFRKLNRVVVSQTVLHHYAQVAQ